MLRRNDRAALRPTLLCVFIATLAAALPAQGDEVPLIVEVPQLVDVAYADDTGFVSNEGGRRETIIAYPVVFELATSVRLKFSEVELSGSIERGDASIVRITSLADGAYQTLNARHLREGSMRSAYFNGSTVFVEVIASPGTGANRVVIEGLEVGVPTGIEQSQCGPADDRLPSNDPRVARLMPVGCTAWMINDCAKCFLSAGHCGTGGSSTVQFNVPFSTSGGGYVFPPPSDQYSVDISSYQFQNSSDDWQYFGTFANSTTGLTAFQAMGDAFTLANPPSPSGTTIRITGHGTDGSPNSTYNGIQQTHTGPMTGLGTNVSYQVDTTGGNSGSPVIWEQQNVAIGVHTNAGCSTGGGGSNTGTPITANALQAALNDPMGRCLAVDGFGFDCNNNTIDDSCDIASGTSQDLNGNDIPDECEPASTVYVDNTGNCPGTGSSSAPYCTIADAIAGTLSGDTIIVRDGTGLYTGDGNRNLSFGGRSITLRSENGPGSVTLDAQNGFSTKVFNFANNEGPDSVLEGFTITGGNSTLSGGGIRCVDASPTIRNCAIIGNITRIQGGGLFIDGGSPTIINCLLADNQAGLAPFQTGQGGGLALVDTSAVVRNCTIANNTTQNGFTGNGEGGGIYVFDSPSASVTNTIVWANTSATSNAVHIDQGASPVFRHSNVEGGMAGTNMLDADPLFVTAGPDGDYHLQPGSPSVSTGDTLAVGPGETDIDDENRVQGVAVEMGSDEVADVVCQNDLGFAGHGSVVISVCGQPLDLGNTAQVVLDGAPANALVFFVLGLTNSPAPFAGGQLVPLPILALEPITANGAGHFEAIIGGGGGPANLYIQAVSVDGTQPTGFGLSNALELAYGP